MNVFFRYVGAVLNWRECWTRSIRCYGGGEGIWEWKWWVGLAKSMERVQRSVGEIKSFPVVLNWSTSPTYYEFSCWHLSVNDLITGGRHSRSLLKKVLNDRFGHGNNRPIFMTNLQMGLSRSRRQLSMSLVWRLSCSELLNRSTRSPSRNCWSWGRWYSWSPQRLLRRASSTSASWSAIARRGSGTPVQQLTTAKPSHQTQWQLARPV